MAGNVSCIPRVHVVDLSDNLSMNICFMLSFNISLFIYTWYSMSKIFETELEFCEVCGSVLPLPGETLFIECKRCQNKINVKGEIYSIMYLIYSYKSGWIGSTIAAIFGMVLGNFVLHMLPRSILLYILGEVNIVYCNPSQNGTLWQCEALRFLWKKKKKMENVELSECKNLVVHRSLQWILLIIINGLKSKTSAIHFFIHLTSLWRFLFIM